jgi:excinuclease UvrABC nuclease subunit
MKKAKSMIFEYCNFFKQLKKLQTMAEQTFHQEFKGYWREPNKGGIPKESGVYCVYRCTYNKLLNNISIHELIYIGESDNVNNRINTHEKLSDWSKYLKPDEQLCYSFTPVDDNYRTRVEAALIYRHKPPVNIEYKDNFPFDKTIVNTSGANSHLEKFFVANKN